MCTINKKNIIIASAVVVAASIAAIAIKVVTHKTYIPKADSDWDDDWDWDAIDKEAGRKYTEKKNSYDFSNPKNDSILDEINKNNQSCTKKKKNDDEREKEELQR